MEQGLRKTTTVRMRNYGRIIQDMVQLAVDEQDVEKKKTMIVYIPPADVPALTLVAFVKEYARKSSDSTLIPHQLYILLLSD